MGLIRALLSFLFIVALLLGGLFIWMRGSLPETEGAVSLEGLSTPVEVIRDEDGIVTIRASKFDDAVFALGFVHAQDRLWQMDFMRRTAAGRLSELAGTSAIEVDKFMRTLGIYQLAEREAEQLSPELRTAVDAYAAGVNAFLETHEGPWPPEYYLARTEPEPWRAADSLVWGKLMALQLSGNFTDELLRARLAKRLSSEQISFLWPGSPPGDPATLTSAAEAAPQSRSLLDLLPFELAPKDASNWWVISGNRTATGKPLLANDPHLSLNAPSIWYLARIETPELTLVGGTSPGIPLVLVGHNGHIAWGLTTTHSDTQDIFIERLIPNQPTHYETPDGPRPFELRMETIEVSGEDPVSHQVRTSRHGPILSDVNREAAEAAEAGTVLALAWTALAEDDRSAEAFFALNKARNWEEFREALRRMGSPHQNIAYADREGNIGFISPARVPIRKSGDGRVPVPGWSGEFDWIGLIPYEELPQSFNPESGSLLNANNKVVDDGYPHLISVDWPPGYRARRIAELIDLLNPHDLNKVSAMQLDTRSLAAVDILPRLLSALPPDPQTAEARAVIEEWDGRLDPDEPAGTIFYAWIRALNARLLADDLREDFGSFAAPRFPLIARILEEGQDWCDDRRTSEQRETCEAQIIGAFKESVNRLREAYGQDVSSWTWGRVHRALFPHSILGRVPVLRDLLRFQVPASGGSETINRAAIPPAPPESVRFDDVHGPGLRAIFDLADLNRSRFMIAPGQSGNPLSALYGNFAKRWRDGLFVELVGGGQEQGSRLVLNPK